MLRNKCLAIFAAAGVMVSLVMPAQAHKFEIFGGYSGAENSDYGYLGGVAALNGDLMHDGWLLRASGAVGQFDYDRRGNAAGDVTDDFTGGNIMAGYQKFFHSNSQPITGGRFTLYVGGDYQNHDLDKPDPGNDSEGDSFGIKGLAELNLDFQHHFGLYTAASYSSANENYWVRVRPGYNAQKFIIGPEFTALGGNTYDQQRYGVYVGNLAITNNLKLELNAGHAEAARRGNSGFYGGAGFALFF